MDSLTTSSKTKRASCGSQPQTALLQSSFLTIITTNYVSTHAPSVRVGYALDVLQKTKMKNTILAIITIISISACSLYAESAEISGEATLLRQELNKQELVLQALKEKLAAIEEKNVFEVSVTSEGLINQGKVISLKELETVLKELTDDETVLIRTESTVANKEVVSLMKFCAKAGVKKISIVTTKEEQGSSKG